ncbi:MAG TPA: carboxypeptidase-like regulatory domain-containing protein [Thermoanaerobaculia bacterium]|nr:carboxypeptidase-like regulatory domain-containing protein [Thermoanaerobaculia bacterium]
MNPAILTLAIVLRGTVTDAAGGSLPGCTVRLVSASQTYSTISDSEGKFMFPRVAPDTYELSSKLTGLETVTRLVDAHADEVLTPIEMKFGPITEELTIACADACMDIAPATQWELPLCDDYHSHSMLIEAVGRGDRSAVAMLRRQYDLEVSATERHRMAGALLGKLDDRDLWADLYEAASLTVRYTPVRDEHPEEFLEYCRQRSLVPDDVWGTAFEALRYASTDRRARALLLDALKTSVRGIIDVALAGLAAQGDHASLPAIRAMLARETKHASWLALRLARFGTAEADAVAFEYLREEDRELYLEHRSR